MEPERPIEKLLRECARKRADQAGAPVELHPATRRLLQGEVARQFRQPSPGAPPATRWSKFWPAMAWGVAAAAMLAAAAALLLPRFAGTEPAATLAMNRAPARPTPAPVVQPPPAPMPAVAVPDSDLRTSKSKLDLGKGAVVGDKAASALASNLLGYDSFKYADKDNAIGAPAKIPGQTAFNEMKASPLEEPAAALAAPPPSSPKSEPALFGKKGKAAPSAATSPAPSLLLAIADNSNQAEAHKLGAPGPWSNQSHRNTDRAVVFNQAPRNTAVLASFQVEQSGQQLRVVDSDGSVYAGPWRAAGEPARRPSTPAQRNAVATDGAAPAGRSLYQAPASPGQETEPLAQNYTFRVVGTNRSLNQKVVFTGNLLPAPAFANQGVSTGSQGLSIDNNSSNATLFQNSRISGRAQVGNQPEIQIEAAPANP